MSNRAKLDLTGPGIVAPEEILPEGRRGERVPMDAKACRQYADEMRQRYRKVERTGRGRLLDEFTAVTGYHLVWEMERGPPNISVQARARYHAVHRAAGYASRIVRT